jgi:hypothetical protein
MRASAAGLIRNQKTFEMPFDRTKEKYDLLPVPMEIFPQVKEVAGFQNQVALYRISFPNGKQVWRITKPVRHYSEIPTSLCPEFNGEKEARVTFKKLTRWEFTTNTNTNNLER